MKTRVGIDTIYQMSSIAGKNERWLRCSIILQVVRKKKKKKRKWRVNCP